ncbi:hypothetical protein [Celerinatantimonas yamalensis]|uniref:Superfamily III holin-X n=1 Tax=Celerinatantimonas yamalensis TaxID=559956 RepID=A0ABW9G2W2_9GAMM
MEEPSDGPETSNPDSAKPNSADQDITDKETSKEKALAKTLADQLMALSGQTAVAAKELGELFRLELQLSAGDAGRLLLTWLALFPAFILAWVSLCALTAWFVYDFSTSISLALATFTLLQIVLCIALLLLRKRFRSGLGFKRTKTHAKRLLQGMTDETTEIDKKD